MWCLDDWIVTVLCTFFIKLVIMRSASLGRGPSCEISQ